MAENKQSKIAVNINQKTYTIVGAENREHVELIAEMVDDKMNEIEAANKQLNTTSLAVLTAINTMNDYLKLKEEYATLLGTMKKKED